MNQSVLITGGSGFVGRNIIELLLKSRPDLHIYNFSQTAVDLPGITNIEGDATTFDFASLPTEVDYVINLLALSNDKFCQDFVLADKINVNFAKSLFEWALTIPKLKKIIHLSSIIIYDNEITPPVSEDGRLFINYTNYSFTKGIADQYARYYQEKFKLPLITFRLSNIYGPHQEFKDSPFLVPSKIVEGMTTGSMSVFNLKPKRDWIYSGDAASAVVKSLDSTLEGVYNLASGTGISVEDIISEIAKQLGISYSSLDKPTTGPNNFYCDISKITSELGWKPTTTLAEGISRTIQDIRDRSR